MASHIPSRSRAIFGQRSVSRVTLVKWDFFCYNLVIVFYVYLLKLKNGTFYAGSTADLKKRVSVHKLGKVLSTKNKRPLRLIFYCGFSSKEKALRFEKYLKSSSGFAFRNKHFV